MATKLNVGVIGLGRLGRAYAQYFAYHIPAARLAAIADADTSVLQSTAEELGIQKAFRAGSFDGSHCRERYLEAPS